MLVVCFLQTTGTPVNVVLSQQELVSCSQTDGCDGGALLLGRGTDAGGLSEQAWTDSACCSFHGHQLRIKGRHFPCIVSVLNLKNRLI